MLKSYQNWILDEAYQAGKRILNSLSEKRSGLTY
jgi:hypothetical protein